MEPVPLCKGEIILRIENSEQLAALNENSRVSSIIVSDADEVAVAREKSEKVVGVLIEAKLETEEDTTSKDWSSDWLISQFRKPVDRAIEAGADFLYIRMADDLRVLRAAVLAATEVSGIGILTELPVDDEGRMHDETSLMAAMGILQRIGVAGMILTGDVDEVTETIDELSPYALIALGYAPSISDVDSGIELPEAEFYLVSGNEQAEKLSECIPLSDDTDIPDPDRDYILAPVGRHAHFVDATIDISDPMDLEDRFEEQLLELEDVFSGAIKIEIETPEHICLLAENQYLLERPVCLAAENPELFEKALRVFNGIALYDRTWEIDDDILVFFCNHYGLVVL